jgi:O-antigen/teichoic acid export membrane protein
LHATVWTLGTKGFEHTLNYVRIIVLARLLGPVDFGVMGIGLVAIAALDTITMPGFQEALVQKKGKVEGHLDTFWTLTLLRTLAIGAILVLVAPLLATFFRSPDATAVLQALAGAEVLRGLVNPGIIYFQKDLEFHKKSINDVAPAVAEVIVAITAAVILQNVWALVFGFLGRRVVQVAVSYWSHPYRPRLSIQKEQTKDLFGFGRWVYLTRIVTFASTQSDSIILARLLGTAPLGLYQMAQRSAVVPLLEIHRSITSVAFPLYSKVQDDAAKLKIGFLRGAEAVSSLVFPLAATLFTLAPEFVGVLLGEKWLPATPVIQVLAIAAALHSVAAASGSPLFLGIGRPWLSFQMNALRAVVVMAAVFPLALLFGLVGAAYAVLAASSLTFIFHLYHSFAILHLRFSEYLRALLPALIAVAAIVLVVSGIKQVTNPVNLPSFAMVLMLVISTYCGVLLVLSWKFKMGMLTNVRGCLRRVEGLS